MDAHFQETQQLYVNIINEVIARLKKNSDKGQLQMSESEIQQFQSYWTKCLDDVKNGKLNQIPQNQINNKQQVEQEPLPQKKVKQDIIQEVKKEETDDADNEAEGDDVEFSEESNNSDAKVEQNEEVQQDKYQQFNNNRYELQREKTLFDKIRELENLKNEIKQEDGEEDELEDPKVFEVQIFAQKTNQESVVSRIRPNKYQKAGLEQVLYKDKNNQEALIPQATLNFNFRTNGKKK